MKQTSKRMVSIGLALLFVVIALLVFFNLIQPEYATLQDLKGKVVGEEDLLALETKAVEQVQKLVNDFKNKTQDNASVALAMPSNADLAGALAQIYGLAQNTGIAV